MLSSHDLFSAPTAVPSPRIDLDLIRKYTVNAPRYTSYPPANRFTEEMTSLDLDTAIAADNTETIRPLSL